MIAGNGGSSGEMTNRLYRQPTTTLPSFPRRRESRFRLAGESGKYSPHPCGSPASRLLRNSKSFPTILCVPISLTTPGYPTVLACGSTALLGLSGDWSKLANAHKFVRNEFGRRRRPKGEWQEAMNQT